MHYKFHFQYCKSPSKKGLDIFMAVNAEFLAQRLSKLPKHRLFRLEFSYCVFRSKVNNCGYSQTNALSLSENILRSKLSVFSFYLYELDAV